METPETDMVVASDNGDSGFIKDLVQLARRLERERNGLKLQLEKLRDAYEDLCDLHFENMKGN